MENIIQAEIWFDADNYSILYMGMSHIPRVGETVTIFYDEDGSGHEHTVTNVNWLFNLHDEHENQSDYVQIHLTGLGAVYASFLKDPPGAGKE